MTKKISALLVLGLALIATVAWSAAASGEVFAPSNLAPQETLTGDWKASLVSDKSKINVNFHRKSENDKWGKHSIGHTFEFAELGLTREQVMNGGPVTFRLTREAGTIDCEGSFQNEKGAGTFRFNANPGFVSGMKSRGFDFEKESDRDDERHPQNRLFTAAVLNVTTALADDLLSANFGKLDAGDLFKAAIFKIDSAFMREMKDTGFPNLNFDDLVKARIFKIDSQFVRAAAQMGFEKEPFESLVKMSIFKVTPQFVTEVRNAGLNNLTIEDAVKLRIFNIDAEFIRKAKAEGVPMNVESMVEKRIGVRARASRRVVI